MSQGDEVRKAAQTFCKTAQSVCDVVDSWEISGHGMVLVSDVQLAIAPLRPFAVGIAVIEKEPKP